MGFYGSYMLLRCPFLCALDHLSPHLPSYSPHHLLLPCHPIPPPIPTLPILLSHSLPLHSTQPSFTLIHLSLPLPPSHPPFPHPTSIQRCLEVGLALRPCWRSTLAEDTSFRSSNSNLAAITQRPGQRKEEETFMF